VASDLAHYLAHYKAHYLAITRPIGKGDYKADYMAHYVHLPVGLWRRVRRAWHLAPVEGRGGVHGVHSRLAASPGAARDDAERQGDLRHAHPRQPQLLL